MLDLDDLTARLAALGEMLEFDDPDPAAATLERLIVGDVDNVVPLDRKRGRGRGRQMLLTAAAVFAVIVALGVLLPDARTAVARWFGLGGVEVKLNPDLRLDEPQTFELPGPGQSTAVVVDGQPILVSAIPARPNETLIDKSVQNASDVEAVRVNGHDGLWIGGGSHEVLYETLDGRTEVERMAANTLLWYDGEVLYRVEGFDELSDALAFAQEQGT